MSDIKDTVLENLYFIRFRHQCVELDTDFALTRSADLVVVYLDVESHLLHG